MTLIKKICYIFVAILMIQAVSSMDSDREIMDEDVVKVSTAAGEPVEGAEDVIIPTNESQSAKQKDAIKAVTDSSATDGDETSEATTEPLETTTVANGAAVMQLTFSLIFVFVTSCFLLQ